MIIAEIHTKIPGRNAPPEVSRFFIGVDFKKPKAFGIYKDEIVHQKHLNESKRSGSSGSGSTGIKKKGPVLSYALSKFFIYFWSFVFIGSLRQLGLGRNRLGFRLVMIVGAQ